MKLQGRYQEYLKLKAKAESLKQTQRYDPVVLNIIASPNQNIEVNFNGQDLILLDNINRNDSNKLF